MSHTSVSARRIIRQVLSCAAVAMLVVGAARDTSAQGCILIRQTSPMFGTTGSVEETTGTWTVTMTARSSQADTHYNGKERQLQRETLGTYVLNRQHSVTATIAYQFSPRISFNVGVPYINASWGIPSPLAAGPLARANQSGQGLGDITTLARVAVFNPETHHTWNAFLGGGVKIPTGAYKGTDVFPDITGNNVQERVVDISAQPGDGGWGVVMDGQAFMTIGRFMPFGSLTYLANPRNTNEAPSILQGLGLAVTPANVARSINSVPDQFLARIGTTASITPWLSASLAWRAEGSPRYDLVGRADGFRRPGVEMYWEPGVTVGVGRHTLSFNVPIGYYYNRFPDPYTGTPGDTTFPEYVAIATYSLSLGGRGHQTPASPISSSQGQPDRQPGR
ncbi:MAG: hypothetical protein GEU82_18120 [Luteitalea sp.]|nr:hypothetical protein [Luteitalea sp.]